MNAKDRDVLRELAKEIAEIAALPVQQETISLWKALNGLKPVRPMVTIDQVAWHEMNVDGELTLRTKDEFCRDIETRLRRTLYQWKHMRVDMVVEPFIDIRKVIRGDDFGIQTIDETAVTDAANDVVGHRFIDQLATGDDLHKIRMPVVSLDEAGTAEVEAKAHEVFDGILTVRMQGRQTLFFAPWDRIVTWHGPENTLMDLAMRPDFMHRVMARLTDAYLSMLDQLEEKGLLGHSQGVVHCSGAYTDDLPAPGFDASRPRARDLWTPGMSQIFSSVSPAMHKEFDIDYSVRWYSRFGLVYYGCCEPLDGKMDIVRTIPHLRKVSMSPWVDVERGAGGIGRDFVFDRKPSPAFLARDSWDPWAVRRDLAETMEACKRHGCPLEYNLKDISTVRYQPQRLWEWADVAMRLVKG